MTAIQSAEFTTLDDDAIKAALKETLFVRARMIAAKARVEGMSIHPEHRASAQNLLAYLALRRHGIRPLQRILSLLGLSSLQGCEVDALAALDRVIEVLQRLSFSSENHPARSLTLRGDVEDLQGAHAQALFGGKAAQRGARIMLTLPHEAASDYAVVKDLMKAGMDCARIDCAHDSPPDWTRMIEHVRRASRASGKHCSVMMDIAGPRLRTGKIDPAPAVLRLRPSRDIFGRVMMPARVWLHHGQGTPDVGVKSIQVPRQWLSSLVVGDVIGFSDARESKRRMRITEVADYGCWASLEKTTYVLPGVTLNLKKRNGRKKSARVVDVSRKHAQRIKLREGDSLLLTRDVHTGRPAMLDKSGQIQTPAMIGCTQPSVFDTVKTGEAIWFDNGKLGGLVEAVEPDALRVLITHAPGGGKLGSDKGIKLPDSDLTLEALSATDIQALEFACQHADSVQLSFVNTAADIGALITQLARLNALNMGVVLKIETRQGFDNLAQLLIAGMQVPTLGVMIAQADLAIEAGVERSAQLQEELLGICEAAHVPLIWGSQVLETLVKTGTPSRAETTDVATVARAACVMLNDGAQLLKAIRSLDDALGRVQRHGRKKVEPMRKLRVGKVSCVMQPAPNG